jgi:hypothetical protein
VLLAPNNIIKPTLSLAKENEFFSKGKGYNSSQVESALQQQENCHQTDITYAN